MQNARNPLMFFNNDGLPLGRDRPVRARPRQSDRAQLGEIVQRVQDGRLRTNIGTVSSLDDAAAAFNPTQRRTGKTIIRVRS